MPPWFPVVGVCPPQRSQVLGDICGFYRAFGLGVSENLRERPDHISIECEFMHFLTFKESYAEEHHGPEKALICRDAQRKFMEEHLGQWGPAFARRLEDAAGAGFYKWLAVLTSGFLTSEEEHLGFTKGPTNLALNVPDPAGEASLSCGDSGSCFSCDPTGEGQT